MSRQINIRVGEDVFAVLAAAAFLDDVNPPDVVRALLETHLPELEADPEIRDALKAREARAARRQAAEGSPVTPLAPRRKGRAREGR